MPADLRLRCWLFRAREIKREIGQRKWVWESASERGRSREWPRKVKCMEYSKREIGCNQLQRRYKMWIFRAECRIHCNIMLTASDSVSRWNMQYSYIKYAWAHKAYGIGRIRHTICIKLATNTPTQNVINKIENENKYKLHVSVFLADSKVNTFRVCEMAIKRAEMVCLVDVCI